MTEPDAFRQRAEAIFNDPETYLQRWMQAAERRGWTLRLDPGRSTVALEELRPSCASFLISFTRAIMDAPTQELGAQAFRESLQTLTFLTGWMAGRGSTFTDALALVHGLHEILPGPLELFQTIELAVGEAFSGAAMQQQRDHYKEVTAKSQLVFALHSQLPCAFLVGEPDRWAVDEAIGRLLMLAMMQGTSVIVVDVSGVIAPETIFPRLMTLLSRENREVIAHAILSGLPPRLTQQVAGDLPDGVSLQDDVTQALAEAASSLGLEWKKTSA